MGVLLTINEKTEEVRRLMQHDNKSFDKALKIVEGYEESDQTIPSNHSKRYNDIITLTEYLDNGDLRGI